ncbi:metallophosphoesterase family protein [Halovenus amylolytica]|uniref:metallophosphoesterase family protein n=1 Tax=Halovenus amylolytica TaxID=2500550 RepID=UPI0036100171
MESKQANVIGLISDIHGNLAALEAVLADMPDVDAVVNAGDVVGYGPWPAECVKRIRHPRSYSIMGNHDARLFWDEITDAGDAYAAEVLADEQKAWIKSLPDQRLLFDDRLKVVHGHPVDRFQYTYQPEFDETLLDAEDMLVLGHTHRQGSARVDGDRLVVNPGSVGQPRDKDPRASYAVINLEEMTISLERTSYDIDRVAEQIAETPIKERNATRLYQGR